MTVTADHPSGLACLIPLMHAKGVTVSAGEFHRAVNVAFHEAEAPAYDRLHAGMWDSLPEQFVLLCDDVLALAPHLRRPLRVADIGCGTGRSAEALLATRLGRMVGSVDLVDTSRAMLARAAARARGWGVPVSTVEGGVESLTDGRYDVVLVCSVLHHIPDLDTFLARVASLQAPNGIFLHVHDPNAAALASPAYRERTERLQRAWAEARRAPRRRAERLMRRVVRRLRPSAPEYAYMDAANAALLRDGIVRVPLSEVEMWSVTDIHVEGLPYSTRTGISLGLVESALPGYELLTERSYAFFGEMCGELPTAALRAEERQLIAERARDGRQLAAAWRKGAAAHLPRDLRSGAGDRSGRLSTSTPPRDA